MKAKLNERFRRFVGTLPGFEDIDRLMSDVQSDMKRADYLVHNRGVIIEQKILKTDPGHKVQKYADQLLGEDQVTANGRYSLYTIFDGLSDGIDHHTRLLYKLSSGLEVDISDADKQLAAASAIWPPRHASLFLPLSAD